MKPVPLFPGNVSVTDLTVYPDRAADGTHGGTPHVHLASTEAYVVAHGRGELMTLAPSGAGGAAEVTRTPLRPGVVLWFTPGVIHRLINDDELRIVVLMSNRGLPEAGDAVMTFPARVLDDPETYAAASALPGRNAPDAVRQDAALARRDLAIAGFTELVAAALRDPGALHAFYRRAAALVRHRVPGWLEVVRANHVAAEQTSEAVGSLGEGEIEHLLSARLLTAASGTELGFGMCGRLHAYDVFVDLGEEP